jgi:hypothetical protein
MKRLIGRAALTLACAAAHIACGGGDGADNPRAANGGSSGGGAPLDDGRTPGGAYDDTDTALAAPGEKTCRWVTWQQTRALSVDGPFDADAVTCMGTAKSGRCADAWSSCQGSSQCTAYVACVEGCSDAPCVDKCKKANPTGRAQAGAYLTCASGGCTAASARITCVARCSSSDTQLMGTLRVDGTELVEDPACDPVGHVPFNNASKRYQGCVDVTRVSGTMRRRLESKCAGTTTDEGGAK